MERELFSLHAVNLLFTVLTLGVFLFWAKTRQRRYLYGHTAVAGDRFVYHGTGRELLLGWLKAVLIFYLPLLLITSTLAGLQAWLALPEAVVALATLPIFFLQIMCFAAAKVGARRYRLSRTALRGIRFSFRGPVRDFVELYVTGVFFTVLTLGLYYPWFATRLQHFLISYTYFGSRAFSFSGRERDLLPHFARALLLSLLAIAFGLWLTGAPSVAVALLWAVGVLAYCREFLRKRPSADALLLGALGLGLGIWYAGAVAGAGVLTVVALAYIWCGYGAAQQRYFWSHTAYDTLHFRSTVTGDGLFRLLAGNFALLLAVTASAGALLYLARWPAARTSPPPFWASGLWPGWPSPGQYCGTCALPCAT